MVQAQSSYNLKNGVATLANLVDGLAAGTFLAQTNGTAYYVDPANGANTNDGKSPATAVADIATAYGLTTANQHDTVYYIAGSSSVSLDETLTWAKNYTHLIGIAAPVRTAQRARIFQTATATGLSPLVNITASGCIFSNLYIFQGVDDATSLINVQVTGGRNYFENVHFAGGGHATQAINGGASLKLNGAEENTFVDCTIGVDTIAAATGMMGITFDAAANRNEFYNCKIRMLAGDTAAGFVEVIDGTGIDRDTIFDNCMFLNTNAANYTMASGFVIPAVAANRPARIFLKDCMSYGVTTNDANDRGVLFGNMDAITGADLSGVAVELIT